MKYVRNDNGSRQVSMEYTHKMDCQLMRQEKAIRKELATGVKVQYTYEGKKYTLVAPTTREEVRRLSKVIALTNSEKTRIAITSLFRSLCGENDSFTVEGYEYACSKSGYLK